MKNNLRLVGGFGLLVVLLLAGCAHPIIIRPDSSSILREPASPEKIATKVGYYIPDDAMGLEVTTPGGGGDSVRYYPYRDLEEGYQLMLNNVYEGVSKVSPNADGKRLAAEGIEFILKPRILTTSSSSSMATWPPTNFSVDLTTEIKSSSGDAIANPRVVGYGQYSVQLFQFGADFGKAGKRAMQDALLQMQKALFDLNYSKTGTGSSGSRRAVNDGPKASGSGVFVTTDGYVLTAAHVVSKSSSVKVSTADGIFEAKIVRIDEANDLAVLKIEGKSFPALPIAPSRNVKLGQPVATIGFPNIQMQGNSPKVTRGEISSENGFGDDPRAWQISVPLQPGNSGGPLLDEAGNIVGIVVSGLSWRTINVTGALPQNVNYSVKSVYASALLEPYLGSNAPNSKEKNTPAQEKFEDFVSRVQKSSVMILVY